MSSLQSNGRSWFLDYPATADEGSAADFIWASQIMDDQTVVSTVLEFDASCKEEKFSSNSCGRKRTRVESCAAPGTKACREKMRRDRLNDRFTELCSILDPGKPPRADKIAILIDATRLLNELLVEVQQLKESNAALKMNIKNLKAEKLELRDEKVRLKAEKERMEQLLKGTSITAPLIQHPAAAATAFHSAAVAACTKAIPHQMPMGMWQWIPPASLDTSQDHRLRPPVA